MSYIAGIGGANIDINGWSDQAMIMRDSNPGTLHFSLGGVCRNICENLARLGTPIHLATVVGDDFHGRMILDGCIKAGIDMGPTRVLHGEHSSCYISLMDDNGDMLLAMSDMHIIKHMDERFVDDALEELNGADLIVCDGNLSRKAVERLCERACRPMLLDPVSTAWTRDLKPFIGQFHTVKPNRMELNTLTDMPTDTVENVEKACRSLLDKGVQRVFVSLGQEGMLACTPKETIRGESRPFGRMKNATGAGDASVAGIAYATMHGYSLEHTLHFAMGAGIVAIASEDTISPEMSPAAVEEMIKEYIL